ncbi:MAG: GNAT family N-acetyltransferase [Clostridia bacterium]|nr:GNAT family N-acetyltransferase [Clostridia bacterium]
MKITVYDKIPDEARFIRETVFLQEQGFEKEYDDNDNIAKHIVIYDNGEAIATCRVYWDNEVNCHHVGRIAVLKNHRGKGLGIKVVTEAEKVVKENGGKEVFISGQVRVAEFYINKLGYTRYGESYMEENVPHVALKKNL